MKNLICLLLSLGVLSVYGQRNMFAFEEYNQIAVLHGMDSVKNPWAGGINYGEVNKIDFNGDGREDLVIFDRVGNRITTFIDQGSGATSDFHYAPQYRALFPPIEDWMLIKDFNCDGKKDIFAGHRGNVIVYENVGKAGEPKFIKAHNSDFLRADYSGNLSNLHAPLTDLPGIIDLDNDGDLDILTFTGQANYIDWIENTQNCGLQFSYRQSCWGHFLESNFTNSIFLNSCTPFKYKGMHSGGTLLPLDLNGDNVSELLLGDISFNNLVALFNNGTGDSAFMFAQDSTFPAYDVPVNVLRFPAAFHEDVTGDGLKDLIVSPHENLSGSVSYNSMWLYKNIGTAANVNLQLQTKKFMQSEMIDMGEGSIPRLADLDGNGLPDLILANTGYLDNNSNLTPTFRYYKNIGSAQNPRFFLQDSNFVNISSYALGKTPIPTFGDLDQDGDLDMIVGDEYGNLHLFNNTGDMFNPNFVLNTGAGLLMDVGSDAAPFLFDMDRDGDLDLVVGNRRGKLSYYQNQSATDPDFVFSSDYFGGVDVRGLYSIYGQSVPYIFEHDSIINLMVGSENGIYQFDSIEKVVALPYQLTGTLGNGTTVSANNNDSPFGTTKKSGRNQMLIKAEELQANGLEAGFITSIAFDVTTSSNADLYWLNIRMKNTDMDSLTSFASDLDSVILDRKTGLTKGWSRIEFDYPFRWDGQSNLVVEVCFDGYIPTNLVKVNMNATSYSSYAWGDITNYNQFGVDGCTMPYLQSSKLRPNIKLEVTPAFDQTNVILKDGYRNAAAFHDFDGDGFIDAILGNYSGGVGYYKGKLYDISTDEPQLLAEDKLEVFPNPGNGNFTILTENTGAAELNIYNLSGVLVKQLIVKEKETIVNLENSASGIYFFVLRDGEKVKTQKVVNILN